MSDGEVVADHDVLLVGGGAAGLRAAIAIAETDPRLRVAVVAAPGEPRLRVEDGLARQHLVHGERQSPDDRHHRESVRPADPAFPRDARAPEAIEPAFATMVAAGVDVFIVTPSAPNTDARSQIVEAAARHRLPAVYGAREFVDAGGLISYGTSRAGLFGRAAVFVDKIRFCYAPTR